MLTRRNTPAATAVLLSLLPWLALGAPATPAAKAAEREALKKTLTETVDRGVLHSARVGAAVVSLDDGTVIFTHNADELLNPASNVKLVTAAAALARLGPEYRFDTEFLTDPEFRANDGKARTLYVRGKGDPSITTERLYNIVSELFHAGLHEVTGDLIVDDSWFDGDRTPPGYDQETSDRAYMAPTGALSLNWNTVGIYMRAGAGGAKATIEVEPKSDFFIVDNQLAGAARKYRRFSVASEPAGDKQKLICRGQLPADPAVVSVWKKIDSPPLYFGQTLKQLLNDRGIKVKGRVKLGIVPNSARMLSVSQSETFDLVLKRMNKHSSNFVAETLIKTLGAEQRGAPGSFAKGISVVEEFLEKEVGIPRGSYVMKNGSGLNDTNRFSALQFARLLRVMWERFPLAPEYLSALGIAGKDGTLRYRFEGSDAVGRLRAKTGTLENVHALSGYVQSVGGEKFIFSTLVNDYVGRSGPVVQNIDALGIAVASSGSVRGPSVAVAEAMTPPTAVTPIDEAKARIKTYLSLAKQADKRNISFLRTAWRSEKDPAVRVVVAESIYRSNPQDYLGARALLDSVAATDDVYGRLRKISREMTVDVPGVGAVVELAAEGNTEAVGKLLELARASVGDATAETELAAALTDVARTAPEELLRTLRAATVQDRDASTELLSRGLVRAADSEHPLWPTLRKAMGAVDPGAADFAKQLDGVLSLRIAQQKAPPPVEAGASPTPITRPPETAESRPGG